MRFYQKWVLRSRIFWTQETLMRMMLFSLQLEHHAISLGKRMDSHRYLIIPLTYCRRLIMAPHFSFLFPMLPTFRLYPWASPMEICLSESSIFLISSLQFVKSKRFTAAPIQMPWILIQWPPSMMEAVCIPIKTQCPATASATWW